MLNSIIVQGRLTKDPELRYTQSQTPVASFSIACDHDYAPQGQERQTDFFDCVAWDKRGEFVSKYFHKGSMIFVSGRLQIRNWTDKDGNKRRSAEIVVNNVYFGDTKKSDSGEGSNSVRNGGTQNGGYYTGKPAFQEVYDDELSEGNLPF